MIAAADRVGLWRGQLERVGSLNEIARLAGAIGELAGSDVEAAGDVEHTTALISALNDAITVRVVQTVAEQMDVDLDRACWLAFGSQARSEQTLLSDQDNGLVFVSEHADADSAAREAERERWMAYGARVNEALAACGQPLCSGRVMAGQRLCCLTAGEWCARFEHWMAHGSGNDLLAARIYFDLRPIAGNLELAQPPRALLVSPAARVPRFVKQMADVVLRNHVPLNWLGRVVTSAHAGQRMFDLKMNGSALFVDAARLWALAFGIEAPGTVPRLRAAAPALRLPEAELRQWQEGFLTLQRLRLQVQRARTVPDADAEERSWVAWDALSAAQCKQLEEALGAARWVQRRIALDFRR